MGLTGSSVGINALDLGLSVKKRQPTDFVIALAGNPNVGKSTLFNNLTGMNQHTGNWPGKTVTTAQGYCDGYVMVDIPGTYSLMAHSAEEEVARNFICFGNPDATIVVCDATCLERNLNLVLQIIEISPKTLVCVNLLDEALRKNISIDLNLLSERLGVPVVGSIARRKKHLDKLLDTLDDLVSDKINLSPYKVEYCPEIETAISILEPVLKDKTDGTVDTRWLALHLLESNESLNREIKMRFGNVMSDTDVKKAYDSAKLHLESHDIFDNEFRDLVVNSVVSSAEQICLGVVNHTADKYSDFDRKIDRVVTSRAFGYPIMIALLALVFWLTISFSNYPSKLLGDFLFKIQDCLTLLFYKLNAPDWLHGILVLGVYRVLAWVVSVMLPPMAIFFPLFTLLEDSGYLPRIAYNLDNPFRRCGSCGKHALTTCMGFGCNAAGVVGCRIIDSPRERLIAILTNNFVPCNGRFPAMITLITVFFIGMGGISGSFVSSLLLTLVILLGLAMTFVMSYLLSKTILRGVPSSFTLELPPYRRPQIIKTIIRSVFDRTLFVLGRAVAVAAPAGAVIWLMANITVGDITLLMYLSNLLDPIGRLLGMDGVILVSFILGFPANEIVLPISIMAYTAGDVLTQTDAVSEIGRVLIDNGWTWKTAVSVIIFSLMHWPCSTTVLTIKKETGSIKWTLLSVVLPTLAGMLLCLLFNIAVKMIGI